MNVHSTYLPLLANKGGNFGIIGDCSSILCSGTDECHGEAGIIGLRIIIHVAILQTLCNKGWSQLYYPLALQMAMPFYVVPSRQPIIHPQPNIEQLPQPNTLWRRKRHPYRLTIAFVKRQEKGYRRNQKGSVL